jgi:hypothetical protein
VVVQVVVVDRVAEEDSNWLLVSCYEPGSITTIKRRLRRTLVRLVLYSATEKTIFSFAHFKFSN